MMLLFATSLAYLVGSISSAILVCKLMRLPDPRSAGSQNPGATNVLRIGGKVPAAITLLGDVLKGAVPVLAAKWYGFEPLGLALITFAAFIGHLYPIFFHFKGGKGVATLIGCLLALSWPVACCWLATWFVVAMAFRYVSLASIVASLLAPMYIWLVTDDMAYVITLLVMGLIVLYRHRSNIAKLRAGVESKFSLSS